MADVFISYHKKSASDTVAKIASFLEKEGISCWYAERDSKGAFAGAITSAIENCKVFLLILNKWANSSQHVLNEVGLAFDCYGNGKLALLPIRVDNIDNGLLSKDMRYYLNRIHIMSGIDSDGTLRVQELVNRVKSAIKEQQNAQGDSDNSIIPDRNFSYEKFSLNKWLAKHTKKTEEFWQAFEIISAISVSIVIIAAIIAALVTSRTKSDFEDREINIDGVPNPFAQSSIEEAAELNYSNALYAQGCEFLKQLDFQNAIQLFSEALDYHKELKHVDIDTARIEYALGIAYFDFGHFQEAVEQYNLALGTLSSLGATQAVSDLVQKKSTAPLTEKEKKQISYETAYVYYLRGSAYLGQYNFRKADADCKFCIEYAKQDPHTGYSLVPVYQLRSVICLYSSVFSFLKQAMSATASSLNVSIPLLHSIENIGYSLGDAFNASNMALSYKKVKFIPAEEKDQYADDESAVLVRKYPDNWTDVIDKESSFTASDFATLIEQRPMGSANFRISNKKTVPELEEGIGFWLIDSFDQETANILTIRALIELCMFKLVSAYEDGYAADTIYSRLSAQEQYGYPVTLLVNAGVCSAIYYTLLLADKSADSNEAAQNLLMVKFQASNYFDKCIDMCNSIYGDCHLMTAGMHMLRGYIIELLGDFSYSDGEEEFLAAKRIFEQLEMEPQVEAIEILQSLIKDDSFKTAGMQLRKLINEKEYAVYLSAFNL